MKEFTVTAKDFAELLASTDKTVAAVALCEVDNGKATGRKVVCRIVSASKGIGGKEVKQTDNSLTVRPDYYNPDSAYEPRKVIKDWGLDWNLGNALKYIARCGKKANNSKLIDLEKAMTYIGFEIEDDNEVKN